MGQLAGIVDGPATGEVLLLAIDGIIESGSPVLEDGTFRFLVPPEAPRGPGTDVRLFVVDGDELLELDVGP